MRALNTSFGLLQSQFFPPQYSRPIRVVIERTILFSDIVSSTHVIEECGDHEWRELIEQHTLTVDRSARSHHGAAVNFTGDGVMAAFNHPAEGLACALRLHQIFEAEGRLDVRLGLHHGPVAELDHDYVGLTAHVAARVTGLAAGGEIAVSRSCYDQARQHLPLPRLRAARMAIRGLSRPVAVCMLDPDRCRQTLTSVSRSGP